MKKIYKKPESEIFEFYPTKCFLIEPSKGEVYPTANEGVIFEEVDDDSDPKISSSLWD